ncbi:MAG: hypothetical protein Tsb005_15880 [Gammaproteobacteria bacterium]
MFRIRQLTHTTSYEDKRALASVIRIYRKVFSYDTEYAAKIVTILESGQQNEFETILLIAEGGKNRVFGFSLIFYFSDLNFAYLDHIASDVIRRGRGYGNALYEATQDALKERRCQDLYLDVPPDDLAKLKEPSRLATNKKRLAFYEQYDARPIINTDYESVTHAGNMGYVTYLVYDSLGSHKNLTNHRLRLIIERILTIKGKMANDAPKLTQVLNSIKDDPIQIRQPIYRKQENGILKSKQRSVLDVVCSGDAHQIHHLKEKGYCEKPARINAILKGLTGLAVHHHKLKHYHQKYITAVHDSKLVGFIKKATVELNPGQLLYPNVFPIRHADKLPKTWEMRAGYYCIDTFTPVTNNVYKAARNAVNASLTGAARILKGSQTCYVICRPPGHHAERKVFGGFCYFNNAAVAANYLSQHGTVAILDIDYHHGNGTQDIFYHRKDVLTASIHGHPKQAYPYFSGFADEKGIGDGYGFNHNFPLYPGVHNEKYFHTLAQALRIIKRFNPDYFVISLGLDILAGDPTGTFQVSRSAMHNIGKMLSEVGKPTLIIQEGGYSISNIREGIKNFFKGMLY